MRPVPYREPQRTGRRTHYTAFQRAPVVFSRVCPDAYVSQQNGRFLAPWEGDMLMAYFVHVRNPHGRGAGSQPPPVLTSHQTEWAIETAMAWIKNLVHRS